MSGAATAPVSKDNLKMGQQLKRSGKQKTWFYFLKNPCFLHGFADI